MKTIALFMLITLTVAMLGIGSVLAGQVGTLNDFQANTPAVADDVDKNFNDIKKEVNDNDTRISTNSSGISGNTSKANSNAAAITDLENKLSAVKSDSTIWKQLTTSCSAARQMSVTPPDDGYLMVTATGTMAISYTSGSGSSTYICLDLDDQSSNCGGCSPTGGSKSAIRTWIPSSFPTTSPGTFGVPYHMVEVFPVTGGTSYTFYINAFRESSLDDVWLFHPTITSLFIPEALP